MNTLSTRVPHTSTAPSSPALTIVIDTADSHRLGVLDRLSLRLGLWLLTRHAARSASLTHETVSARRAVRTAIDAQEARDAWRAATGLAHPTL